METKSKIFLILIATALVIIIFWAWQKRTVEQPLPQETISKFDRGVAPNYEVDFDARYDFSTLAKDGIKRVNLYHQWKDFEQEENYWTEVVDPVINKLESLGMRASLIVALTDTDCPTNAPASCWLDYGIPSDIEFNGFDQDPLARRLENFVVQLATRYSEQTVTHIFIGNETDLFLRLNSQYAEGFFNLIQRLQSALMPIKNRAKLGSIFTFDIDRKGTPYSEWRSRLSKIVEIPSFTIYPTLLEEKFVEPTPDLIKKWFDGAKKSADNKSFVITETGYPASPPFGSIKTQEEYVKNLLDYLATSDSNIEFISWWSLADSPTHPDEYFRVTGLKNFSGQRRPAYRIWTGAAK